MDHPWIKSGLGKVTNSGLSVSVRVYVRFPAACAHYRILGIYDTPQ